GPALEIFPQIHTDLPLRQSLSRKLCLDGWIDRIHVRRSGALHDLSYIPESSYGWHFGLHHGINAGCTAAQPSLASLRCRFVVGFLRQKRGGGGELVMAIIGN